MLAQDLIRKEIQIVPKIGFYENEDEFIRALGQYYFEIRHVEVFF